MKILVMFVLLTACFAACKKIPTAAITVSKTTAQVGEPVEINNTSSNCDISVVNIEGEGILNNHMKNSSFQVTDRRFTYQFEHPGVYTLKVKSENTNFFSGTEYSMEEKIITILPVN